MSEAKFTIRNLPRQTRAQLIWLVTFTLLGWVIAGCAGLQAEIQGSTEPHPSPTIHDSAIGEILSTPTARVTLAPDAWKGMPIIPEVSETAREIYQHGFMSGNDPHAFSKVGDCQNVPSMFMWVFDDPSQFSLGDEYSYLQDTIDWFAGSFSRESQAVRRGYNAASILSPFWANPDECNAGETPLECEYRINKPIIAIISLETWWEKEPESYEEYLREIIEVTIDHGVVPILTTKADNLERDHSINIVIFMLAQEYDIPLWNFWKAVQPLPAHGLMDDGFHLTFAGNYYDDPERMKSAWPWRNLTALQALDAVWTSISAPRQQP